ncbi:F0F1 ATP synthase subunit B [Candidatus Kuenenbacteria bacterium]|nr:F0F1 ATP synthase subunit B [Candidatus Kuenenbacteria bacterium]
MSQLFHNLGIEPLLLIAQVVNFLLLFFILKKFLYNPVIKMLNERTKKIEKSLKEAKEIEEKRIEIEEQKTKEILKARKEAEQILEKSKEIGEKIKIEMNIEAEQKAQEIILKARQEIKQEKSKAIEDAKGQIADLIILSTEKILKEKFINDKFPISNDKSMTND